MATPRLFMCCLALPIGLRHSPVQETRRLAFTGRGIFRFPDQTAQNIGNKGSDLLHVVANALHNWRSNADYVVGSVDQASSKWVR